MVKLSFSKSLFLNEKYFSYEFMRVDELRIKDLREKIWDAVEYTFKSNF